METNPVVQRIKAALPDLTKSEARIARFILNNEAQVGLETGASLAAATQVSEITVSRFLKKIGFRGMRDLKDSLKTRARVGQVPTTERLTRLLSGSDNALIEAESRAIQKLVSQLGRPEWRIMIDLVADADRIFVTGFQTVKGMSEDFARRLGIVREAVRFVTAHDGGLVEWAAPSPAWRKARNLLVMVDILPYAKEAERVCQVAKSIGFDVVVLTDEFNNWAYAHTKYVFHAESKTGLFLETTATLTSMLNFIVHGVAEKAPEKSQNRIDGWLAITRDLELF